MRLSEVALVNRPTTSLVDAWLPGFPIPEIERGPWQRVVTQPGASFLYASATSVPDTNSQYAFVRRDPW